MTNCKNAVSTVTVSMMKKVCRYHRAGKKAYETVQELTDGLCLHAFHAVYPFALALLYDSKHYSFTVSCPEGRMFSVKRVKSLPRIIPMKVRESLLCRVGGYQITCEPLQSCHRHQLGECFNLNIRDPTILCPASLHTIYPFLLSATSRMIHCPDHNGIIYHIA